MANIIIKKIKEKSYQDIFNKMISFTKSRTSDFADEIWFVEHDSVFTQGMAGKKEHLINPGAIPVIQTDRGGQVTYHGPGQLVAYFLIDLRRRKLSVRSFVSLLENSIINLLKIYDIESYSNPYAPGVYVNDSKIASIGLKVKKGYTYHGIALNIDMDLEPFSRINPCGYKGLKVIDMASILNKNVNICDVKNNFEKILRAI
jgi:lipoyl(octanoyl) transferase